MPPVNYNDFVALASAASQRTPDWQIALESIGLFIALSACVAILITGCYGPLGWKNEWPLIRALPNSWKKHIYPTRIEDSSDLQIRPSEQTLDVDYGNHSDEQWDIGRQVPTTVHYLKTSRRVCCSEGSVAGKVYAIGTELEFINHSARPTSSAIQPLCSETPIPAYPSTRITMATATEAPAGGGNNSFRNKEKPLAVRSSNIVAARAVADAIRTSLGPRGMDKMIRSGKGETIITNDGSTMLQSMSVLHPTAKMLVNLSNAQDVEAGDGTTSVVVICGALLGAADRLLSKGIHPSVISESFQRAANAAVQVLHDMSQPIALTDTSALLQAANTSLSSKIVSQYANLLGPMAVNSVTKTIDLKTADNVDLKNIRTIKKVGGTIEDSELVDGVVLTQPVIKNAGGPIRMEKAKIGLIQFQLSPPKPDMENTISVNDYRQMDRIVKEERMYLLNMAKKIKKSKCNVLLIQKSILRDAVNDLSLHFLAKLNILVIKDIERDEVEFICKSTGCKPVADVDSFTEDKLGSADLVEEVQSSGSRMVKVTGTKSAGKTVSVVVRGANSLILDEAERSLHDALCVVRCLVKKKALIAGGGAPEIEIAAQLSKQSRELTGTESICWKAFAEAMEVIPTTLAENAGLNPIRVVTDLRHRHELGERNAGVSIKSGGVNSNISKENVLQPLLVSTSAIELAAETVKMILRIDDIALSR